MHEVDVSVNRTIHYKCDLRIKPESKPTFHKQKVDFVCVLNPIRWDLEYCPKKDCPILAGLLNVPNTQRPFQLRILFIFPIWIWPVRSIPKSNPLMLLLLNIKDVQILLAYLFITIVSNQPAHILVFALKMCGYTCAHQAHTDTFHTRIY